MSNWVATAAMQSGVKRANPFPLCVPLPDSNNRIVHRSDYFLGYGSSFRYSETVPSPYWLGAQAMRAGFLAGFFLMSQTWLHGALKRVLPAAGEGPSRKAMLEGHFQHTLIAKTEVF